MPKNKKIYVTGCSGFIGSQIVYDCKKKGYEVIGISRKKIPQLKKELKINIIKSDLTSNKDLILNNAEVLIHCASPNDIISKSFNSGMNLALLGTKKLLDAALKAKIKKFIYFSSAKVYGSDLKGFIDNNSALKCDNNYALNHFFGEQLCRIFSKYNNINITIVRPSNVYGVPFISTVNRLSLVPFCFIEDAINHGKINIQSSGKQVRNFISTEDLSFAIINIIENFPSKFNIFNLGSNTYFAIKEIAVLVADSCKLILNKEVKINYHSKDPKRSNKFVFKSKIFKYKYQTKAPTKSMISVIETLIDSKKDRYP